MQETTGSCVPGLRSAVTARCTSLWLFLIAAALLSGCRSPSTEPVASEAFQFGQDTLAYRNELTWEYREAKGRGALKPQPIQPPPEYTQRCFAMARAARQFHVYAQFRPNLPQASSKTMQHRIRQVLSSNGRCQQPPEQLISFPGYAGLDDLSATWEEILKQETGGAWRSYLQRGNWRMIFPFSRRHQTKTAQQLERSLTRNRPSVVHVVTFPALTINHVILIYKTETTDEGIRFLAYDPNDPTAPLKLTFDANTQTFRFPRTQYFVGGEVDIYEIYRSCCF